jgi:hypothetical protein
MAEMARERRSKPPIQPDRPVRASSADGSDVTQQLDRLHDSAKTDRGKGRAADVSSPAEEALRKRVTELEGENTALWKKVANQDRQLAELKAGFDELRKEHQLHASAQQPSAEIGARAGGGPVERGHRAQPERRWHLPTDAANNLLALAAGGAVTTAAEYVPHVSPAYAGMGATGLAIGAGTVAWWREHRKGRNDAGHRSED